MPMLRCQGGLGPGHGSGVVGHPRGGRALRARAKKLRASALDQCCSAYPQAWNAPLAPPGQWLVVRYFALSEGDCLFDKRRCVPWSALAPADVENQGSHFVRNGYKLLHTRREP